MSDSSNEAADQARFAAREFVAQWTRDTGEQLSAVLTDRMLFAYEMGFLRGHGEGYRAVGRMMDSFKKGDADT